MLTCGCCDLFNFKKKHAWKQAALEMKRFDPRELDSLNKSEGRAQ